jgi:hypothetical protein
MTLNPYLEPTIARRMVLELGRRENDARMAEFAAEVLYVLGRACPFPALVYYEPDVERLSVRMGGLRWATMTAEEARRLPTMSAAAVLLGLRGPRRRHRLAWRPPHPRRQPPPRRRRRQHHRPPAASGRAHHHHRRPSR